MPNKNSNKKDETKSVNKSFFSSVDSLFLKSAKTALPDLSTYPSCEEGSFSKSRRVTRTILNESNKDIDKSKWSDSQHLGGIAIELMSTLAVEFIKHFASAGINKLNNSTNEKE